MNSSTNYWCDSSLVKIAHQPGYLGWRCRPVTDDVHSLVCRTFEERSADVKLVMGRSFLWLTLS